MILMGLLLAVGCLLILLVVYVATERRLKECEEHNDRLFASINNLRRTIKKPGYYNPHDFRDDIH